jgi:pyruvate kinase
MIHQLQRAQRATGKPCTVMMDLAGPKLRTGEVDPAPAVIKVRPDRDTFGRVCSPARLWLYRGEPSHLEFCQSARVSEKWLLQLKVEDVIVFRDARESKRQMCVVEVAEGGCWVELNKTAYLIPGVTLRLKDRNGRKKSGRVLDVSRKPEQGIRLKEGVSPAFIGCTLPSVFSDVKAGEPVWFDDGKIGGLIERAEEGALHVVINHAPGGAKLKSDKGINLPQSELKLDALSSSDIAALEFACEHADVVQMSFVNSARDVQSLISHLTRLKALDIGVVLKIETRLGFENLAELLMSGMQLPKLGVMIARGDLAIENGFERTAELQEELLCICEAAHVPVIWATQVLETLAKTGRPSRAEITDAAIGARAECVMLNKGAHIVNAVECLDDVLGRMKGHRCKKNDLMRKLKVATAASPTDPV